MLLSRLNDDWGWGRSHRSGESGLIPLMIMEDVVRVGKRGSEGGKEGGWGREEGVRAGKEGRRDGVRVGKGISEGGSGSEGGRE